MSRTRRCHIRKPRIYVVDVVILLPIAREPRLHGGLPSAFFHGHGHREDPITIAEREGAFRVFSAPKVYVAHRRRFFEKEGLRVTIVDGHGQVRLKRVRWKR